MASPKKIAMLMNGLMSAISVPARYASGPVRKPRLTRKPPSPATRGDQPATVGVSPTGR